MRKALAESKHKGYKVTYNYSPTFSNLPNTRGNFKHAAIRTLGYGNWRKL